MTTTATRRLAGHVCDILCRTAHGSPAGCTCSCRGANHGVDRITREAHVAAVMATIPDPFALISGAYDEDPAW